MTNATDRTQITANNSTRVLLGHVTIAQAFEDTDRGYETASWWETIEVPAGRYEVWTDGRWATATLTGKVTACNFASRIGATALPYDTRKNERIGTLSAHHIAPYLYAALEGLGRLGAFELADGIEHDVETSGAFKFDRFYRTPAATVRAAR